MRRIIGGLIMAITATITVLHDYPDFPSWTASGTAAWGTAHSVVSNVTGYATVAESGDYANLTGTPSIPSIADAWPIGSVYISVNAINPATSLGFGTWAFLGEGQVLVGLATGTPAFSTLRATGGSLLVSSSGTISTPTFAGDSYTPSGTNAVVQFTPAGTNAVSLFRDAAAGTNAASAVTGSVSADWPTGVPAASTVTLSASVNWPTGVPAFAGTAHQHGLPISHLGTAIYVGGAASLWGSGTVAGMNAKVTVQPTATVTSIVNVVSALGVLLSQTATAAGVITWPASVPLAQCSVGHAHVITWPASVPPAVAKTLTAAAQVFTGVTGSVSGQVFTGTTGTVSGQAFTGIGKAPTGTISKPTYVGDPTTVVQPFFVVTMWERTA